jgi:hypothetical protein
MSSILSSTTYSWATNAVEETHFYKCYHSRNRRDVQDAEWLDVVFFEQAFVYTEVSAARFTTKLCIRIQLANLRFHNTTYSGHRRQLCRYQENGGDGVHRGI